MGFGPKALPSGNKWGGSKVNPYAGGKVPRQKKGGGATKPAPTKTTPAAAPKTIQQLAHELVQAQLVPYYQQLRADEAAQTTSERARQAAVKGFTTSMVNLLKGQPAALKADYAGAIDQTAALAEQSSDALRAANPNTQNQALLAAIGAPEAQRAQLTELANRAFSGGAAVLQHTRGTLPGQTLTGSQLAQVVHARNLPSIAAAQGTQALRSFLAQAADERGKLARERSDLRGRIPGLEQQTLMGLQQTQAAQEQAQTAAAAAQWERDFKVQVAGDNRALAEATFGLNTAKLDADVKIKTATLKANTTLKAQRLKLDAQIASAKDETTRLRLQNDRRSLDLKIFNTNRDYNLRLDEFGLKKNDQKLKAIELQWKMDHPPKKGGFTTAQATKLRSQAIKAARVFASGGTLDESRAVQDPKTLKWSRQLVQVAYEPLSYEEAFQNLIEAGIPPTMAYNQLNRYYSPSERAFKNPPGYRNPLKINWGAVGALTGK